MISKFCFDCAVANLEFLLKLRGIDYKIFVNKGLSKCEIVIRDVFYDVDLKEAKINNIQFQTFYNIIEYFTKVYNDFHSTTSN